MPRLEWGVLRERTYELGVDRGVLYPKDGPGVAWPGLRLVETSASGGDVSDLYFDGQKYSNDIDYKDFSARISSFSPPKEFTACEGVSEIAPGLYATHQTRDFFGFSFRNLVGSALKGINYGYKIHLIYNAMAFPATRTFETQTSVATPVIREWQVQTVPYNRREYTWFESQADNTYLRKKSVFMPGSHFVVSSRSLNPQTLSYLEDVLYGTENTEPELPSPTELIEIIR